MITPKFHILEKVYHYDDELEKEIEFDISRICILNKGSKRLPFVVVLYNLISEKEECLANYYEEELYIKEDK